MPGRNSALALALAALIVGCGSSSTPTAPHASTRASAAVRRAGPTAATVASGRLLVEFKRAFGQDPRASELTVDTNGVAETVITYGGIDGGHEHVFNLPRGQLQRLRRLVDRTRMRDTWCCDARYHIYWVSLHHRGWRLRQHRLPGPMRPLVDDLRRITAAYTFY